MHLGISIGTSCGIGSIFIALGIMVVANKWKKGIQSRLRQAYFKKKSRSVIGAIDLR